MSTFNPNGKTFESCLQKLSEITDKAKYSWKKRITTSQDTAARKAAGALGVTNVPNGFKKSMLPVFMDKPSTLYVSIGAPDTEVPKHSHDEGDGFRYIVSGSIIYAGKELHAGDWMFIPAGRPYSFKVGSRGATMFYCYQCCCA